MTGPGRFTLGEETQSLLYKRLEWTKRPIWTGAENLAPQRESIPGLQAVASRYTDYGPPRCSIQGYKAL